MGDKIHTSHSRKDLLEMIEIFNLQIADCKEMNKKSLQHHMMYELSKIDEIVEDNEFYFIQNKDELLQYLIHPDSSKTLTVKEKEKVMELAKYIIMYCKNGFYLSHSPFIDYDDMIKSAKFIANYGDIPSVQKAICHINKDQKLKEPIELMMSSKCKKRNERKKRLVQKHRGGLEIKKGIFVIDFS